MGDARPWHRLFGLSLQDFFTGLPVRVELEHDLSLRQQLLDVVVIRLDPATPLPVRLPDGLEELAAHNLITFKSHQEALDEWALLELLGHYVNYRKQAGPTMRDLPPTTDFRLFAVCVRLPQVVTASTWFRAVRSGVYDAEAFGTTIRVVVAHELPLTDQNVLLHAFSARAAALRYAAAHYRPRSSDTSTLLQRLWTQYIEEGDQMAEDTVEAAADLVARVVRKDPKFLKRLTPQERLDGLTPDDLLAAIPAETLAELLRRRPTPPGGEPE